MDNKIRDYKCTYANSVGINEEITRGLDLKFPEAYLYSDSMQVIAKAIKEYMGDSFCLLPFCRTVEAEAMGADIKLGDGKTAPRAGMPVYKTLDDLLTLPEMDFNKGRLSKLLSACKALKEEGENVCLELVGPFTILTSLMEARTVFKAYRKQREEMKKVFNKIGGQLIKYIEEGKKTGVDVFVFSDSAGALDILGPVETKKYMGDFFAPFMENVSKVIDNSCIFLLCPKFAYSLIDTGYAEFKEYNIEKGIEFSDALLLMRGQVRLAGQVCIKTTGAKLVNGVFREVVLK